MDGQQHNTPDQYFAAPDGAPDISDEDHAAAVLGTPMEADDSSFALSAYDPLPLGGQIQAQQHDHQHFPYHQGSSSISRADASYGFGVESGPGPSAYQTASEWQQTGQHLMFANAASVSVPGHVSLATYGYGMYNEAHPGDHTEDPTTSHGHNYVAPMDTTLHTGYGYNWEMQDTTGMAYEPTPLQSPTGYSSTTVSPLATGTGTATPTSYASSRSGEQYSTMYAGTTTLHTQAANVMGGEPAFVGGKGTENTPVSKKARTRQNPSRSDRPSSQAGPSSSATTASSVPGSSRDSILPGVGPSSAQATSRQAEKKEDKKMRGSHNLVEKQYRNRLNAQFEGLMNALPESLKLHSTSLGVVVESGEGDKGDASDTLERKPSKAEVLEMARMHIRALELERDTLVNERDGLLGDINRLRGVFARRAAQKAAQKGDTGESWTGEELGQDFKGGGGSSGDS